MPMRLLGGSLEKPSKEDGGGVSLEGASAVSAALAAARHRSVAGPPAGFPTKRKSSVSAKRMKKERKKRKEEKRISANYCFVVCFPVIFLFYIFISRLSYMQKKKKKKFV